MFFAASTYFFNLGVFLDMHRFIFIYCILNKSRLPPSIPVSQPPVKTPLKKLLPFSKVPSENFASVSLCNRKETSQKQQGFRRKSKNKKEKNTFTILFSFNQKSVFCVIFFTFLFRKYNFFQTHSFPLPLQANNLLPVLFCRARFSAGNRFFRLFPL